MATNDPEVPASQPEQTGDDGLALNDVERRYLEQDGYDSGGHLSHENPGETLRELIHEIRQTRTAIRLAQATFVSKTDLEVRLKEAGEERDKMRKVARHRFVLVVVALFAMGIGGGAAAWAFHYQQVKNNYDRCIQSNNFKQGDRELWNEVINLSDIPHPTPEEQQKTAQFEAFLDKHDALSVCHKP